MILAVHALSGAAAAVVLRSHPTLGLTASFLSHFLLDIPRHWHYPLRSLRRNVPGEPFGDKLHINRQAGFLRDLFIMGVECVGGFVLAIGAAWLTAPDSLWLVFWGSVLGVLPDFMTFLYHLFPRFPLHNFHSYHKWIHNPENLDDQPLYGVSLQAGLAVLLIFLILLA